MRKSVIFSNKEFNLIVQRVNGNYDDATGQYSRRVRPKLKEIYAWNKHEKMRKYLKKCLEQKKKFDEVLLFQKKKTMTKEDFIEKEGY